MKNIVPILLLGVLVCAGCATRYDMKLTNGMVITSKGKPKVDSQHHIITFIDAKGQTNVIPEFKVVEVAPHSAMEKEDAPQKFNPVQKQ